MAGCLALFWLVLWTPLASAQPAAAPPLQLHCDEDLIFTQQDLAEALALRIPAQTPGGYVVVVRATGDGMVEVSLGERRRSVYLGDHRGAAAARWVALAVEDLIMQEAAPPLLPPPVAPVAAVPPRLLFQLYPTIGLGTNENPLLATGSLGASVRLYRGLRWTLDVGYGGSPKARLHEVDIDLQELPLRSGPAWHLQRVPLELRLSAVVIPYWLRATTTTAPTEAQYFGVLAGGGVALWTYLPLYRRLLAMVAIGADLLASRAEFLVSGQPVFDTARFAVWLSAGLALRSQR